MTDPNQPSSPQHPYSASDQPEYTQPLPDGSGAYQQPAAPQYSETGYQQPDYQQQSQGGWPAGYGDQNAQQAPDPYWEQQAAAGYATAAPQGKGFFGALFDFSFTTMVTPKIIRALYIVMTVLLAAAAVIMLIAGLASREPAVIIGALIGVPLMFIIYLALVRMSLEMYYAVIRLSEDVHHRLPRQ